MGALMEAVLKLKAELDKTSQNKAKNSAKKLKNDLKKILGALGITLSVAGLVKFTKSITQAAIDAESVSKRIQYAFSEIDDQGKVVSDDLIKEIDAWAEASSAKLGLTETDLKNYLLTMDEVLRSYGFSKEAVANFGAQIVETGVLLSQKMGVSQAEGIDLITKAMKGDEEAAAKLRVQLNDTTRQNAMFQLGIDGTYASLDEGTKALVDFTATANQLDLQAPDPNPWDALHVEWENLKVTLGQFLLPFFKEATQFLSELVGEVNAGADSTEGVNSAAQIAHDLFQNIRDVLGQVRDFGERAVEMFGGMENTLAVIQGIIVFILGLKVVGFISGIVSAIGTLSGVLGPIATAVGAALGPVGWVVAGVIAVGAAVEDFVGFLNGESSVIGGILESFGVDTEALREDINNALGAMKEKFVEWKDGAIEAFNNIGPTWEAFKAGWAQSTQELMDEIGALADLPAKALEWGKGFMDNLASSFENSTIGQKIKELRGQFDGLKESIGEKVEGAKEAVGNAKDAVVDTAKAVGGGVVNAGQNYKAAIDEEGFAAATWSGIKAGTGAIKDAGKDFLEGGLGFMNNLKDGIVSGEPVVEEEANEVAGFFSSLFKHSTPEQGPMSDDDVWTVHFMENLVNGLRSGQPALQRMIRNIAEMFIELAEIIEKAGGSVQSFASMSVASARAIGSSYGSMTVIQNNNFSNQFNGADRQSQVAASRQMNQNAGDATAQMAHAMAVGS